MNINPVNNWNLNNIRSKSCQKQSFKGSANIFTYTFNVTCVQLNNSTIRRGRKYESIIRQTVRELKENNTDYTRKFWSIVNSLTHEPRPICSGRYHIIIGPSALELQGLKTGIKKSPPTVTIGYYRTIRDRILQDPHNFFTIFGSNCKPKIQEVVIQASSNGKRTRTIDNMYLLNEGERLPVTADNTIIEN